MFFDFLMTPFLVANTLIPSAQSFISPRELSFFIGIESVYQVARSFDTNKDRLIDPRDELSMSPTLFRTLDTDNDRTIKLFELNDGLEENKLSIHGVSDEQAVKIAKAIFGRSKVYAVALGPLGRALDSNQDGWVTDKELATALSEGKVAISGTYIVGLNDFGKNT